MHLLMVKDFNFQNIILYAQHFLYNLQWTYKYLESIESDKN